MPRLFAVQLKDAPAERYEQWVNVPVYTRDYEDCVGWLGCELPEDGHSCEFAELAGDGAVTCASSSKVNRLRDENAKLRESVRNLLTCVKHEECEESCPNYEPMYTDYGYEKNGSTVVESEYRGCCTVGLENCNSMLFNTDEYLRELGIEVTK